MGVGDGRREPAGKVGAVSDMDGEMGLVALEERAREGNGGARTRWTRWRC